MTDKEMLRVVLVFIREAGFDDYYTTGEEVNAIIAAIENHLEQD
jgi:hypothetical protein